MSKKIQKIFGCHLKNGYPLFIANQIVKKRAAEGLMLRVYLCHSCNLWHITKNPEGVSTRHKKNIRIYEPMGVLKNQKVISI